MPEGDTVWRTARNLDRALTGRRIKADFRVPSLATTVLEGEVVETVSRGKHLLTRVDSGDTLHTHLKMEGSWHLYRPGERWRRERHEAREGPRGVHCTLSGPDRRIGPRSSLWNTLGEP